MNAKKIILHLLIRIGILVILVGSTFLLWYFILNPSGNPDEYKPEHIDGDFGVFILLFIVITVFYIGLIIEMFYLFEKKEGNLALI
ncbi:MAG: hypothetical protein ABI892_19275, partial [Flavobacterium sp.]